MHVVTHHEPKTNAAKTIDNNHEPKVNARSNHESKQKGSRHESNDEGVTQIKERASEHQALTMWLDSNFSGDTQGVKSFKTHIWVFTKPVFGFYKTRIWVLQNPHLGFTHVIMWVLVKPVFGFSKDTFRSAKRHICGPKSNISYTHLGPKQTKYGFYKTRIWVSKTKYGFWTWH